MLEKWFSFFVLLFIAFYFYLMALLCCCCLLAVREWEIYFSVGKFQCKWKTLWKMWKRDFFFLCNNDHFQFYISLCNEIWNKENLFYFFAFCCWKGNKEIFFLERENFDKLLEGWGLRSLLSILGIIASGYSFKFYEFLPFLQEFSRMETPGTF